jgi:GntR family transcriptional regulator, arabinose operon transcriptional repressor
VKAFGASRPTVNRALRDLQVSGVIERRAGSGSYVRKDASGRGYLFGLLIPELGRTEIFEPIWRGMADARHGHQHALLWGSSLADAANPKNRRPRCARSSSRKKWQACFSRRSSSPARKTRSIDPSPALDAVGFAIFALPPLVLHTLYTRNVMALKR